MRLAAVLALAILLPTTRSFALDEHLPDAQSLSALEAKAEHASLKDQAFLYAQLTHAMTELASHQMAAGDGEQASRSLAAVQKYTAKLHSILASDTKKLKDAEILMRHTAFRMKEVLGGSSADDRAVLELTLKQLDQVEAELMLQVFQR
jgi:hypothetical protein